MDLSFLNFGRRAQERNAGRTRSDCQACRIRQWRRSEVCLKTKSLYNQPIEVIEVVSVRDYEFDQFRLTPELYELVRIGRPVRLEKIPFDLLVLLVERRPELVSRDAITAALWGNGGYQDLDQSLNTAIRKVRLALRDSADEPRFIQTVVGRGYRFLPDVSVKERAVSCEAPVPAEPPPPASAGLKPRVCDSAGSPCRSPVWQRC